MGSSFPTYQIGAKVQEAAFWFKMASEGFKLASEAATDVEATAMRAARRTRTPNEGPKRCCILATDQVTAWDKAPLN